ncbi:MAG: prepilin-type N-terminal cleavage/methylation domain-containing protein [Deltaproteobacteria bacterium]|nr:prepilin-type N-terminal cleavage/methylation domain-containing protein [Deltaproteobacteria bacterium]
MMQPRRGRLGRRGMTLIEAMVAFAVLTIGVAAIFSLITSLVSSQRVLRLNSQGIDLYSRLSSEIRSARCDFPAALGGAPVPSAAATRDPGLTVEGVWIPTQVAAPAGSMLQTIGNFDGEGLPTAGAPVLQVDYMVRSIALLNVNTLTYEVDIRVRQIQNDAARDSVLVTESPWLRVFTVQKACNARADDPLTAGWRG